jgi:hypothetical protein
MSGAIPSSTVLYAIVRDHFETFRAQAASLRSLLAARAGAAAALRLRIADSICA